MIADVERGTQFRMQQAVDHTCEDLSTIRTDRAHPAVFNRLNVDYYGAPTPLQQLATFNSPDPRTMLITPLNRSAIAAVERVVREAGLGMNPSNDRDSIQVVVPQLMGKRHGEYIKPAKAKAEDARIAMRSIHRHFIDALKKLKKKSGISEDKLVRAGEAMDATTRKYIETIDGLLKDKEAELSEV